MARLLLQEAMAHLAFGTEIADRGSNHLPSALCQYQLENLIEMAQYLLMLCPMIGLKERNFIIQISRIIYFCIRLQIWKLNRKLLVEGDNVNKIRQFLNTFILALAFQLCKICYW
jgi:hypothetical protein